MKETKKKTKITKMRGEEQYELCTTLIAGAIRAMHVAGVSSEVAHRAISDLYNASTESINKARSKSRG